MAPNTPIGPIRWNTIIEYALPIPALALLAGLLLEGPSGQTSPYDSFMYPLVAATLLIVDWLLIRKHISIGVATMLAASGGSFFFASKLGYLLFFYPNAQLIPNEMTESLFWVPTVYILAAFVPGTPGARQIPLSFFGVFTLTSLTYLVTTWGQLNYPVLYALLQLNLANLTSAVLVISFNALRVDYERAEAKAEVLKLRAATDSLTGLANRHHFEHVLEQALEEAAQHGERLAVAFIDLDSFKAVNDSLGHKAGDELLCKVGCVLTQHVRDGDLVARLGGDEFVLLLRRLNDTQTGLRMVERLSELLVQPFELDGRWQRTSASIGVSFFPDDGREDLLRRADSAMYEAKRSGKNGVRRFDRYSAQQHTAQQRLAQDLRDALEREELYLVYQPIVDLATGRISSLEALLRWEHPDQGMVSPAEFVPLAEQHGLILPLGTWVLAHACKQLSTWHQAGFTGLRVNVNVSAFQFAQPGFVDFVRDTLSRNSLAGTSLAIELTESVMLRDPDAVNAALRRLQAMGIGIALDDFGTGYSSLSHLNHLAIDTVKVDQVFVKELGKPLSDPHFSLALVRAVVAVAEALNLNVVAEGIETAAQRDLLRSLGCHQGQGYFFAHPLAPADVAAHLSHLKTKETSQFAQLASLN